MEQIVPKAVELVGRTEVSIAVRVEVEVSGVKELKIEFKESGLDWSEAASLSVDKTAKVVQLEDLNPTSSYQVRVFYIDENGQTSQASPTVAFDTQVPDCGPKCQLM